jgi:CubicO group peptidase (beta-lactamase class C family)
MFQRYLPLFFLLSVVHARAQQNTRLTEFVSELDTIRKNLGIPGMSVAVLDHDNIVLSAGLGFADIERQVKADTNTTFRIASVTKTFTSTLLMQLVEEGKLDLDTPISQFGLNLGNGRITVRHLLTHTSEGTPGSAFQYNGYRFGKLGAVIEQASGRPFFQLLMENIIRPAGMWHTAPGNNSNDYTEYCRKHPEMQPFFDTAHYYLAAPYALDESGRIVATEYLDEFGAFGGLASTARDLLKYASAVEHHRFISAASQRQVFTANKTNNGAATPYGLGWFVQNYKGEQFYWHYGQTQGESALFVIAPSRQLALAVLANTDKLSAPFPLGDGDILTSPAGQLFYKLFINKTLQNVDYQQPVDSIKKYLQQYRHSDADFYNKELITQATIANLRKDTVKAARLYNLYTALNKMKRKQLDPRKTIVALAGVGINREDSASFTLSAPSQVRVYGVGENCSTDLSSWCDYGWIENAKGKIIWQMQGQKASHAGGAVKNQRVETIISLPAGNYKLKYRSDGGHAFEHWDSAPPVDLFWGIAVLKP